MLDFHEKRKIRGLVYSRVSIGVILILAILLSFSVYERFVVEREMKEKMLEKESELEHLKGRAALLEEKVDHLQNERGIEEELRSRFDVAKDGEQVVIIVDDEEEDLFENFATKTQEEQKSVWQMLKFW